MADLPSSPLGRRGLFRAGGLAVSLGAVIAACGDEEPPAPGRVGNAPEVTPLSPVDVDDAVLLRTATSLEYTAIDVYARAAELGALDDRAMALLDRFVADHQHHADRIAELTVEAGGEPYECANQWLLERSVTPLFQWITGDEASGIPPSDDVARDLLTASYAFESVAGATYQQLVELLREPSLRQEIITIGAEEVRHAAAVAIARTGAPEGYVSPELFGGELDPEAEGGIPALYAVPTRFGSLAPIEVVIGAPNEAGTRATVAVQTPAENAYVYAEMRCTP